MLRNAKRILGAALAACGLTAVAIGIAWESQKMRRYGRRGFSG